MALRASGLTLSETHRHRILTGDSSEKNGRVVLPKSSKLESFFGKYLRTTSSSDRNQNLVPTNFRTWKHIDGNCLHSGVSMISDILFREVRL